MENRLAVAFSMLILGSFLLGLPFCNMKAASASFGGSVDVYTQKEINNGRGLNTSSDAFSPGDIVQLNAFVSYNEYAVLGVLVSFQVAGPQNSTQNIVFSQGRTTDQWGIASFTFRIPYQEQMSIGEWIVVGNARIGDNIVVDTLTFKVGWIVEIASIKTLDQDGIYRDRFALGAIVGVEVGVRSIAMQERTSTLTVAIFDTQQVAINSTQIDGFIVPPNDTLVYVTFSLRIPRDAGIGLASASANAFTRPASSGGIPYCPEVSESFYIMSRDLAISDVVVSPNSVEQGETVYIDVTAKNQGSERESFAVTTYYDGKIIDIQSVSDLPPSLVKTLRFDWNTTTVSPSLYLIKAVIETFPDEIDTSNNSYDGGQVEVKPRSSEQFHDIAVLSLVPSDHYVLAGESLDIEVIVRNDGEPPESFIVTVFYGSSILNTVSVENLMPGTSKTLLLEWITTGVAEGNYTLKAEASLVSGETNVENNIYVDGIIEVRRSSVSCFHDISIVDVCCDSSMVHAGTIVVVDVIVKNGGNASEAFDIELLCNETICSFYWLSTLSPLSDCTVSLQWNTANVSEGIYRLIVHAGPVEGEGDIIDNTFEVGYVQIVSLPRNPVALDIFLLIVALLLVTFGFLLILSISTKKRKKKNMRKAFNSGWISWFYGYSLLHQKIYSNEPT